MVEDEEGFLYPVADESKCIDCGLCEKVCPVINQDKPNIPIETYAAKNPDDEVRLKSSSGGIFSLIAKRIISEGGVVFGAKFNDNWEIEHDYTASEDGLACFMGSKYVQSLMAENFKKAEAFLKEGKKVLFTGTPCQIAGFRKFLRKDYDNLLLVDVICHGVPSPKVWRDYISHCIILQKADHGNNTVVPDCSQNVISHISFRDKTTGWKKYGFVATKSRFIGGENSLLSPSDSETIVHEKHFNNIFMKGFLSNIYLRPSCYHCPSKSGKSWSDITLGDFWGISAVRPKMDDDKGTSAILINTQKGADFFSKVKVISVACSYESVLEGNPSIEKSVPMPRITDEFWKLYDVYGPEAAFDLISKKLHVSLPKRAYIRILSILKGAYRKTEKMLRNIKR